MGNENVNISSVVLTPQLAVGGFTHALNLDNKDGNRIGELYLRYTNEERVFDALIISSPGDRNDTLYYVNETKLYGKLGLESKVSEEDFMGYKIILEKSDYIVFVMVDEFGRGASDDLTIEWNYNTNQFELMKTP